MIISDDKLLSMLGEYDIQANKEGIVSVGAKLREACRELGWAIWTCHVDNKWLVTVGEPDNEKWSRTIRDESFQRAEALAFIVLRTRIWVLRWYMSF